MKMPNFFIVGAPKCGTTAMNDFLDQHPDIFMCEKEAHYFGKDLAFRYQRMNWQEYVSKFTKAGSEKRLGDASTWYLYSRTAAEEIHSYRSDAKILIMLRNPVEMIYSLHSQALYNGDEDIENFAEALDAEYDRAAGRRIPATATMPVALNYKAAARYAEQVERYLQHFPREQVMIILYDDFKKDTPAVYRETLRFLEVDTTFLPNERIINPNKVVRSRTLLRFLGDTPNTVRTVARGILPNTFRKRARAMLTRMNTRYQRRLPMHRALREKLKDEFAPDIAALAKIIDRDLSAWMEL